MQTLILAAVAIPVLMILDLIWIGGFASNFYKSQLGSMMRSDILYSAAIGFYLIYSVAVAYFVLVPAINDHSFWKAVFAGALLGAAAFGAYDFTNWATLNGWPPIVSIVDLTYGTVATALTSGIVYTIATKVFHW